MKVISLNGLFSGSSGRNSPADEMDVAREKQLQNGNETSPMAAAENKNDVQAHPNNQNPFTNYITMEVIQFCLLYFERFVPFLVTSVITCLLNEIIRFTKVVVERK